MTEPLTAFLKAKIAGIEAGNSGVAAGMAHLAKGGGPPHDSDMEARVTKLEENYGKVLEILGRLDVAIAAQTKDVGSLKTDIAEIKGKLSHMPTMWSVAGTTLAINAGILALGFGLARILAGP